MEPYTRTDWERENIHRYLRKRAEELMEQHPEEIEEPYEGAGFCVCQTCQVDVPLLLDAAEMLAERRTKTTTA